jgi:hypothetical protein
LCERAVEQLEKVQTGQLQVPGGVRTKSAAPTVTNRRVALDRYPATRVERPRSSGTAEGYVRRVDESADGAVG